MRLRMRMRMRMRLRMQMQLRMRLRLRMRMRMQLRMRMRMRMRMQMRRAGGGTAGNTLPARQQWWPTGRGDDSTCAWKGSSKRGRHLKDCARAWRYSVVDLSVHASCML